MRSKHLLLMLLLALMAPWVANAQSTLTVYDGTNSNSYVPFYGTYADTQGAASECVIPSDQLTDMACGQITAMKFYISTAAGAAWTGTHQVYLGEVSSTTLTGITGPSAFTVVKTASFDATGTELTITFDTPYTYGGGNLLIGTYVSVAGNWKSAYFNGVNQTENTGWYRNSASASGSGAKFLPKTTFTYTVSANPAPVNLEASNITSSGATLSWEVSSCATETPTSYKYQYQPEGGDWTTLTTTTARSIPLTGLTANTTYNFKVQAIYSGGESGFASTSFTTDCAAYSIPYSYGFETAADMNCWTVIATGDYASYTNIYEYESYAHTGNFSFRFMYTEDPGQYLISPQLSGIENGLHLEFWYRQYTNGVETFQVGTSSTDNDPDSFTWGTEITASTEYQRFSANYPANVKYVAVKHTSDDQYYLFLDDFLFEESASCLEPTDVVASNETTTGASINWTAGGDETAWDLYVTNDATDVPGDATTPTVANTSTKPYPLTSLTPATTYYVYVRAKCTENSAWSSPAIFNTDCESEALPYSYDFNAPTQFDICWNVINTNTSYNSASLMALSETNKCLAFYIGTSASATLAAVLPEIDATYPLNQYEITFDACYANSSYTSMTSGKLRIGIMTDPADFETFELVKEVDITDSYNTFGSYTVRFNNYTGTGRYIAIQDYRTENGYVLVNNLEVNPLPDCIEPDGLTVSDETAHGATFAWTENGTATAWQLYISDKNIAPADDIAATAAGLYAVSTNPYTLASGLTAETDYYVWVRANCGGTDGNSTWVGPETFTTAVACPAPTGLAADNVTNHTADLSWTGTSESYKVMYRTAAGVDGMEEDFTNAPDGWLFRTGALATDGTATLSGTSSWSCGTNSGVFDSHMYMNLWGTKNYWLITPSRTITSSDVLNFDLAYTKYNNGNVNNAPTTGCETHRFAVLISTDDMEHWTILREWNNSGSAYVLDNVSQTGENSGNISLGAYAGETAYIAFFGHSETNSYDNNMHFDNVMIGTPVTAGVWVERTTDASPYQLTGLLAERKYEAKVQGNCGSEGMSAETASIFFTTDIPCPAPTGLAASNATSSSFDLSWTNGGSEDWIVAYKTAADADFTEVGVAMADVTEEEGLITYTLSSLEAEKEYTVKVRDNCEASYTGDGVSEWTTEVVYSTVAACSALNPVVSNITHHTATVAWDGESASGFTVNYRTAAGIDPVLAEDFEDETHYNDNWTVVNMSTANAGRIGRQASAAHTGSYGFRFSSYSNASTYEEHLINKNELTGLTDGVIEFYYKMSQSGYTETFKVGYSSTDSETTSFAFGENHTATTSWQLFHEAIPAGTKYVSIQYTTTGCYYYIYIDDIVIGNTTAAGTTQTVAATASPANLSSLTAGQKYEVWVTPNCDVTLASDIEDFTTVSADEKWFIAEGDWATPANWEPTGVPTIDQDVVLKANATIASGVAEAKSITGTTGTDAKTLTIESGAKLKHLNTGVVATVKKTINGYGAGNEADKADYYLITNPLTSTISTTSTPAISTTNMLTGNYDLYSWDYSGNEGNEWRNYEASTFSLTSGMYGYLYANEATTTLSFTGTVNAYTSYKNRYLNYTTSTSYDFPSWYLIGNPYLYDAYLANGSSATATALPYYRMNEDGDGFDAVAATTLTPIAPMEGIFYQATSSATVYMTTTAPAVADGGLLNMNLRSGNKKIDNAIVTFGDEQRLEKLSFREGSTKVYIPQDGKDYAVVNAEAAGELPLNFKAEKNGSYTLSFNNENVEFGYLHLIDNMTGNDVDLLQTPSYSFEAKTTDYASRFKLVFATGNNGTDETFAFFNNGNLVINNEGNATLQVVDVMGRILRSETINGSANVNVNAAPGVYVLRLINGDNVRTQKVVVE